MNGQARMIARLLPIFFLKKIIAANVPRVGADGRETITYMLALSAFLVKLVTHANRRGLFQSAGDRGARK